MQNKDKKLYPNTSKENSVNIWVYKNLSTLPLGSIPKGFVNWSKWIKYSNWRKKVWFWIIKTVCSSIQYLIHESWTAVCFIAFIYYIDFQMSCNVYLTHHIPCSLSSELKKCLFENQIRIKIRTLPLKQPFLTSHRRCSIEYLHLIPI